MTDPLRIAVLISLGWAVLALMALIIRARSYGRPELFARAAGRPWAGVFYAFGPGMSPAAKESTRDHLPAYFAGVGYHLGIFAAFARLALLLAGVTPAPAVLWVLQALALIGALCGAGLLVKRLVTRRLRGLSCPDDYVSNLLATAFPALAFTAGRSPTFEAIFLVEAAALFLYAPLGKIRHCLFFFRTRYYLGAHFGRRGVFPPAV